jgi:hypothetical protein
MSAAATTAASAARPGSAVTWPATSSRTSAIAGTPPISAAAAISRLVGGAWIGMPGQEPGPPGAGAGSTREGSPEGEMA